MRINEFASPSYLHDERPIIVLDVEDGAVVGAHADRAYLAEIFHSLYVLPAHKPQGDMVLQHCFSRLDRGETYTYPPLVAQDLEALVLLLKMHKIDESQAAQIIDSVREGFAEEEAEYQRKVNMAQTMSAYMANQVGNRDL